jgi:hypothetical protein
LIATTPERRSASRSVSEDRLRVDERTNIPDSFTSGASLAITREPHPGSRSDLVPPARGRGLSGALSALMPRPYNWWEYGGPDRGREGRRDVEGPAGTTRTARGGTARGRAGIEEPARAGTARGRAGRHNPDGPESKAPAGTARGRAGIEEPARGGPALVSATAFGNG